MKIIEKWGVIEKTPWLSIDEAAAYCGISRAIFTARAGHLPHGGDSHTKLYHVDILDAWLRHELDAPPSPGDNPPAENKAKEDE